MSATLDQNAKCSCQAVALPPLAALPPPCRAYRFRIVTLAAPDFVGSATLVADTVTVLGDGTLFGAVYNPPAVMVPTLVLPPATPFTFQVTPKFDEPVTVAVNC